MDKNTAKIYNIIEDRLRDDDFHYQSHKDELKYIYERLDAFDTLKDKFYVLAEMEHGSAYYYLCLNTNNITRINVCSLTKEEFDILSKVIKEAYHNSELEDVPSVSDISNEREKSLI